jgi:hypothetical protein
MSLAIAVLLAAEAPNLPQVSPAYQKAIRSYAACIETKMVELEPSKADTDDIFEAAEMQCAGTWGDSFEVMVDYFNKRAPAPSGKSSEQMSIEILDRTALMSKNRSRVVILRKRAGLPPIDAQSL